MLVEQPEQMPLCATAQGLEFLSECQLVCSIPDGIRLSRWEPAGACYDGATIPRWAWSIIGHPLEFRFRWASYWHDRLCEGATTQEGRRLADAVFLYLLHEAGVGLWKRSAMWLGCRIYGTFKVWKHGKSN